MSPSRVPCYLKTDLILKKPQPSFRTLWWLLEPAIFSTVFIATGLNRAFLKAFYWHRSDSPQTTLRLPPGTLVTLLASGSFLSGEPLLLPTLFGSFTLGLYGAILAD